MHNKLDKYLSEGKLPFSKQDIAKALNILTAIEDSPIKIKDWDSSGSFEIEHDGKRQWYKKNLAVNQLFAWIQ